MSEVVFAVGASHSTLMNTHWDEVKDDPGAVAFRESLDSARVLLERAEPDVLLIVGSNHFRGFYLDLMPMFTIGVGECIASGEAGTPEGPLPVAEELAQHVVEALVDDDFDVAFSARLRVDHGITHALQYLAPSLEIPIVPLVVNVFAPPLPSLSRCDELGRTIGRAIGSDGAERRIAVIGSGGLSHRLPWPNWKAAESNDDRFLVEAWTNGREHWKDYEARRRKIVRAAAADINSSFDLEVLHLVADGRLDQLCEYSTEDLERIGGNGAQELRTWLVASAVAGHQRGEVLGYWAIPPWLTGMSVALLQPPLYPSSGQE